MRLARKPRSVRVGVFPLTFASPHRIIPRMAGWLPAADHGCIHMQMAAEAVWHYARKEFDDHQGPENAPDRGSAEVPH
jgi:hypothetical protein